MSQHTNFLDLPVDILLLIFPHLDAYSFLALTSTCKTLHRPEFLNEPTFWSHLVRRTFRVANQPVIQHDGARWHKLFKRLRTETRVYGWGDNSNECIAQWASLDDLSVAQRAHYVARRHIGWPEELPSAGKLGIISDLQCGGWSVSLLSSKGALYLTGQINGQDWNQEAHPVPTLLKYPPGFPLPHERYDAATAVKQFSHGRAHVLALSDNGRIWSWDNIDRAALNTKFMQYDVLEGREAGKGRVKKVVAGWSKSAALVEGTGILVWEPLQRARQETEIEDTALVLESVVVPRTGYQPARSKRVMDPDDQNLALSVGEVLNFIVLEELIIFNTSLGKVFFSQIFWSNDEQRLGDPVEIPLPSEADNLSSTTDIQGTFRSFAVFTTSGAVLTSTQDRLRILMDRNANIQDGVELFTRIPALQNKGVIALAFGDYHFHALHAPGYITSYGKEPGSCGALGLGGPGNPEARLRGIRYQGMHGHGQPVSRGDGQLVPHAYTEGRRVWFEKEKKDWIKFLTSGGADAQEAAERVRMAIGSADIHGQGEVSEWIEQEGRDWEEKYKIGREGDDGLPAYFALSVAAAGWHSGALVLVNESLVNRITEAVEMREPVQEEGHAQADADAASQRQDGADTSVSIFSQALELGRWYLGLPSHSAVQGTPDGASRPSDAQPGQAPLEPTGRQPPTAEQLRHDPVSYGAAPRPGFRYVWADAHFPRLRLSSGAEMPGDVPFDNWRYDRPEWDLEVDLT